MYPIPGTVHNKKKCILEQMYPISGTVHNKTLNKCILSLVQFTIKP